jgi:type I restriction enzyme S subunit
MAHWLVAHTGVFLKKTTEATHGTKRFDLREIVQIPIGIPEFSEQEMITARINSLSIAIQSEQETSSKLGQQKHGLMHDLLTGRVRVPSASSDRSVRSD